LASLRPKLLLLHGAVAARLETQEARIVVAGVV
jgi:hypothetical protein